MKKLLFVTRPIAPPWDEASKNFAYNLACNLKNFEPTLLTPGRVRALPKHIKQLPIYSSGQLSIRQKLRLTSLYPHRDKFDIVHIMLTPNKLNAYSSRTLFRGSKVKTVQTIATLREDKYGPSDFDKILFGDKLITYSDFAKKKLEAMGHKNVSKIYPGIDFSYYKPSRSKDQKMLKTYGISRDDFVVAYPGEYVRLGVTDQLVELMPKLINLIPNIKFVFACRIKNDHDAAKKASIQKHFKQLGIAKNIVYTDTVSDMAKFYNISDVILFPVLDMTGKFDVPLTVIEAMACAKPIVITDLPVLSEFTANNNSVIISRHKLAKIVDKIQWLHDHPAERQKLGKNARGYVMKNFDIKKAAKEYEKIYKELTA